MAVRWGRHSRAMPPCKRQCLRCLALAFLTVAILFGCGPRYSVHQGGLRPGAEMAPKRPLEPTESIGTFTTDYAPPADNDVYGGPTNRVRVDVPAALIPHEFVSVSTASGVMRLTQALPSAYEGDAFHVAARHDSAPAQSLAATGGARTAAQPVAGKRLVASDAVEVNEMLREHTRNQDSAGLQVATAPQTTVDRFNAAGAFAVGDSDALKEPATASQPIRAQASEVPARFETAKAGKLFSGPDSVGERADSLVLGASGEVIVPRDVGDLGQPLAVQTEEPLSERRTSSAIATTADDLSVKDVGGAQTGTLLAERKVVAETRASDAKVSAAGSDAGAAFRQRAPVETEKQRINATARLDSEAAAARADSGDLFAVEDSDAARFNKDPRAVIRALTSEALERQLKVSALREDGDRMVVKEAAMVTPPWISVLLEGRFIGPKRVSALIDKGVLDRSPLSKGLIRYRFFIFNESESVAADVKIVNRLDRTVTFFAVPKGQEAAVESQPQTDTVVVSIPRLESMEAVVADFYVEVTK